MTRATAKQMELFEDGGLKDEGGTVDPVSGNDVPPGSTKAEVRDDIPAQLSEGEFVFPADVVRFIGLEKLMKIRQRAKAGLQRMEDMGQMGNSEEAIMPDDLPFSIDDLDMEDDGLEMAQGGVVSMANGGAMPGSNLSFGPLTTGFPISGTAQPVGSIGAFNPQIPGTAGMNPLGTAAAPMQAASSGGVNPNLGGTAFTPTTMQQNTMPTFQQAIGPGVVNVDYEEVTFTNEAGQTIILRRNKRTGQMIDPIPAGFTAVDKTKTAVDKTTGTGTKTARVVDEGDDTFEQDQEDMKRDQARVDAAKAMGYKNFAGFVPGLLSTFGLTTLPEGTVNGIGFVSDGKGSLFDPLTGRPVPEGLLDALKNSWNEIDSTLKGEDRMTRDLIARGKEQETKFGRDFYTAAGVAKVDRIFAGIKDDIKDGKYGDVDFDDFSDDYIDKVQDSIRAEAEKGNYITESGRIANPFEASGGRNRGDGRFDSEPDMGIGQTGPDRGTQTPSLPDYSGPPQDEGPGGGDNQSTSTSDDYAGFDFDDPSDMSGESFNFNKGGLAKQMKHSGLASKK